MKLNTHSSGSSSVAELAHGEGHSSGYELFVGAGGTTAVLAGVGTLLAAQLAGITKWRRLFGVSGGSIPTALTACGYSPVELLHLALDLDYGKFVDLKRGVLGAPLCSPFKVRRPLPGHPEWAECHWWGLLSTGPLGQFLEESAAKKGMAGKWPENFATMATTRYGDPVYFHPGGVDVLQSDGHRIKLTNKPEQMSVAVRASSTVGGIMVPLAYRGYVLFDGCLSRDAFCPAGVPIRHYGSDPRKIVAVRVNEIHSATMTGRIHRLIRRAWQVPADFYWGPETAGVIEVHPVIQHVATIQFEQTRDEKWYAILLSLQQSMSVLAGAGILTGENLRRARGIMDCLGYWRDAPLSKKHNPQRLSYQAEKCFSQYKLF